MEKARRDKISRDCRRLIRESKELLKRSHEIFGHEAEQFREPEALTIPKRKNKSANNSFRHTS
jgi:hypothetical protein